MAASSPTGIATSMAISEIRKVPANSGTEPNCAPPLPSPARPADARKLSPGAQVVPVMKSHRLCIWKKRIASETIDSRMPKVVTIDITPPWPVPGE